MNMNRAMRRAKIEAVAGWHCACRIAERLLACT